MKIDNDPGGSVRYLMRPIIGCTFLSDLITLAGGMVYKISAIHAIGVLVYVSAISITFRLEHEDRCRL